MTDWTGGLIWDLTGWLQTMAPLERPPGWEPPPRGQCVAPGCGSRSRMVFVADEVGRLGGRDWQPGDRIEVCDLHAMDVYDTIGKVLPDEVAWWLRPDAADPPNTWQPHPTAPWSPW